MAYDAALALQQSLVEARRGPDSTDQLLLLEHPPVITLGRGADPAHVLCSLEELRRRQIELHEVGRGGDVTFHGPGQLIGYPILALVADRRDAHRYLRDLEEVLLRTVAAFGIDAARDPGLTGIWVGTEKLAAIGVRLSTGWVTSHGFALNVDVDPDGFSAIVPCGLEARGITSMARLTGSSFELKRVAARAATELAAVFELDPIEPEAKHERLAVLPDGGVSSRP